MQHTKTANFLSHLTISIHAFTNDTTHQNLRKHGSGSTCFLAADDNSVRGFGFYFTALASYFPLSLHVPLRNSRLYFPFSFTRLFGEFMTDRDRRREWMGNDEKDDIV